MDNEAQGTVATLKEIEGLEHEGRFEEAATLRQRYAEVFPDDYENVLAWASLLDKLWRPKQAVALMVQLLDRDPDNVRALLLLSTCFLRGDVVERGAMLAEKAVELAPQSPTAQRNLAWARDLQGRREEAVEAYRLALSLDPNSQGGAFQLAAKSGDNAPARMSSEQVVALFDRYAAGYDNHMVDHLQCQAQDAVLAMAREVAGPYAENLHILDLGCGTGLSGELLRPLADELVGVDLSPAMLLKAREKAVYDDLRQSDVLDFLNESEDRYDLLTAVELLNYFGELEPLFAGAARALKPQAHFIFTCEAPPPGKSFGLKTTSRYGHSIEAIRAAATATGLAIVRSSEITLRREGDNIYAKGRVTALA